MTLLFPFLLLGLLVLPLLWWLLRALPPAPRVQSFPPLRLLDGLQARLRDARRVPPWLLALRIAAAALLVVGLAQPVLLGQRPQDGRQGGTLLLAIDNGWAAAPDWAARLSAADDLLQQAERAHRPVSLLLTAPDRTGGAPAPSAPANAASLRTSLDDSTPLPWPPDRAAAARALQAAALSGSVAYIADGLAGPADAAFVAALRAVGPVQELRGGTGLALLGRPGVSDTGLTVPLLLLPAAAPRVLALRAETATGSVLARQSVSVPAGADKADVGLVLPAELRNQVSRLRIEPGAGAGSVRLLDEGDRRRPVGLLTQGGAETPLLGALFFLRRALSASAELREGTLDALLARPLSVLVAPDGAIGGRQARDRVADWVRHGGMLIRFAGPRLAAETAGDAGDADPAVAGNNSGDNKNTTDPLLPGKLLGGARQLGGAMSWGQPEHPAAFAAGTPFENLPVPADVLVSRQVLAEPTADLGDHVWARLSDGTPLVTHARLGSGQVVLFHVTSTADWSNLPLSGLFPSMLSRLVQRAAGLQTPGDSTVLAPAAILAGDGELAPPPPSARGLPSDRFGRTPASAIHPAGLYGPPSSRRALNLADALPPLAAQQPVGIVRDLANHRGERPIGPWLLAAAVLLLLADLLATLALRGLLYPPRHEAIRPDGRGRGGLLALLLLLAATALPAWPDRAEAQTGTGARTASRGDPGDGASTGAPTGTQGEARDQENPIMDATGTPSASGSRDDADVAASGAAPGAALETRLAYVVTGDAATDAISRQGLDGLSRYANARTSARLGTPDGVVPGRDDLAFYPLLYWPVTPQTVPSAPGPAWQAALNGYMSHGGILMIDTQGAAEDGSGDAAAGYVPVVAGTGRALQRATAGLEIPPLARVAPNHVLMRTFYLLHGMPGRYAGAPVWVADAEDAGNDGVSPVILGGNDWAAAWAADPSGQFPYATIPGGEEQRTAAFRFGVNAVIYALTGNYKSDQVHVPALLKRLGQAGVATDPDNTPDPPAAAGPP